jgi:hypothetical protein
VNHCFEQFFTLEGIDIQHTVTYTPQKNDVVERKNRSLKETAWCMIHACSLAPEYWAEAINSVSHIQNIVPHKALKGMTPFQSWCGRKHDVQHFIVFLSPA